MSSLKLAANVWLSPLPLALLLICLGLLLLGITAHRRAARVLLVLGITVAVAATLGPVADMLLRPLETRYPAVLDASRIAG